MDHRTFWRFQTIVSLPEFTTLSKPERKKFWFLVRKEVPPEKALFMAKRFNKNAQLEDQAMQNTPQPDSSKKESKKRKKNKAQPTNVDPNTKPDKAVNSQSTKSFESPDPEIEDKPKANIVSHIQIVNIQPMSVEEMKMVHDALLLEIANEEAFKGPSFCGFFHKKGFVHVICENYYSQNWLVKKIQKIKPWPAAELSTKARDNIVNASTFLPGSEADSVEKALKLIQIQNKGLNTDVWKVLSNTEFEGGRVVKFSIDRFSLEALEICKFKVFLGFKKIFFKILKISEPKEPNKVVEGTLKVEASAESVNCESTKNEVGQDTEVLENNEQPIKEEQVQSLNELSNTNELGKEASTSSEPEELNYTQPSQESSESSYQKQ